MAYTYGMVQLNSGSRFRARKDEETGKISYMSHQGPKNASTKVARSFKPGYESTVPGPNRYIFPDEHSNPHVSHLSSHENRWKEH